MTSVVIGAGSGIGAAVADALPGTVVRADLRGTDVSCDVLDRDSLDSLAASIDRLDALVITAGLSPSLAPAKPILDVNLTGTANVLDAFDHLIGEGSVVICTSSIAAYLAPIPAALAEAINDPHRPGLGDLTDDPATAYMASKVGVQRLVRRLAGPYGKRGARIVSIAPGIIATPMTRAEIEAGTSAANLAAMSAIGRPGLPGEIAAVIAFVCSPAATLLTGIDLPVEGGILAALNKSPTGN